MKYILVILMVFILGCGNKEIRTEVITVRPNLPKLHIYDKPNRPDVMFYPLDNDTIKVSKQGLKDTLEYMVILENNLDSCTEQVIVYNELRKILMDLKDDIND